MYFDPPTLFGVIGIVGTTAGLLLLFSWMQQRRVTALAHWGLAFVLMSCGVAVIVIRGPMTDIWSTTIAPMMTLFGYGLMWCGARTFEGRKCNYFLAGAGALIWLIACEFDGFASAMALRMRVSSAIIIVYTLLAAAEYWRARDTELMSRWPAIVVLLFHAVAFTIRIPLIEQLPFPGGTNPDNPGWFPVGAVGTLLHYLCLAFLVMNMTKERAELQQRKTALLDPLTGVANRRAFLDRGERVMRRSVAEGKPVAVLVLDLDKFKQINDTFGHHAGDRVLCGFCETVNDVLRPTDIFGRLGGEEFACLLPDVTTAEAVRIAERIRVSFEECRTSILGDTVSTVSVGVATTRDGDPDLDDLMAAADRALYQAKAKGRNRVEQIELRYATPTAAAA
jgi:diguanylate cyclase (GGDEF)-like protein